MTFWEFLDRRMERFDARAIAGAGIFLLTGVILLMVWWKPELAEIDLFKTIAQAIIVQGLIGLAMAYLFTAKEKDSVHRKENP